MSSAKQRCACEVYRCKDGLDPDPLTHVPKRGRLLAPSTVHQHRRDDKIWHSAQAHTTPDSSFLLATANPSRNDPADSVVISRTLVSEAGNRPYHHDHCSLRPGLSDPRNSSDESLMNLDSAFTPPRASDDSGSSVNGIGILQDLQQYRALFESLVSTFAGRPPSGLRFHPPPSERSGITPNNLDMKHSLSFCLHQESIKKVLMLVDNVSTVSNEIVQSERDRLLVDVQARIAYLDQIIAYEWKRQRDEKSPDALDLRVQGPTLVKAAHLYRGFESLTYISPPLLVVMLAACLLHVLGGLSRHHSNFVLVILRTLVTMILAKAIRDVVRKIGANGHLQDEVSKLVEDWPNDIRTVVQAFQVDPELQEYACCARCFSLYGPFPEGERSYNGVPETCTNQRTPSSTPCGKSLFQPHAGDSRRKALRCYWYQPFSSWIARLMSRPDVIKHLRKDLGPTPAVMHDIWDGGAFRDFKGPDGRPYFEVANGDSEIRLVFSLFVDWFNPFGNKQSGKHVSFGAIYMVCYNLPIHLRYHIENVYMAGVIPGPKEPSDDSLNHILHPLINELLQAWSPGFHLEQTATHLFGCVVRCAIIPLVCDLLAARKTAGFGGLGLHEGKFCALCLQDHSQISNTDVRSWPRRTWLEHLSIARMWRDAPTESVQAQVYKKFGVRWSELLRLPYWNPIRFTIIDAMHNLFVGDLQHHCRNVLGMSSNTTPSADSRTQPHTPAEQQEELSRGIQAIRIGSLRNLTRLRRGYIVSLALANNVSPKPVVDGNPLRRLTKRDQVASKNEYATALIQWYGNNPGTEIRCPNPFPHPVVNLAEASAAAPMEIILDQKVLFEVWKDMAKTVLPTWVARAPRNFGSASHGKLKADQWRTVCLVNLVITLCRIWGTVDANARDDALLRNFLSLVIAVRWATMRSTSKGHAVIVQQHLAYYVTTTNTIFGSRALVYNNHASLHIPECLEAFGPAHGWWAFPFERYNGLLQRYNTNSRIGEMELTILKSFCRGSNLRALLAREHLPEPIREIQPIFEKFFGSGLSSAVLGDMMASENKCSGPDDETPEISGDLPSPMDGSEEVLTTDTYNALLATLNQGHFPPLYASYLEEVQSGRLSVEPRAWTLRLVKTNGLVFSTAHEHKGNSYVLFKCGDSRVESAGQIQRIFAHRRRGTQGVPIIEHFFVLWQFQELSLEQAQHDPYRRFPLLSARLCQDRFLPSERVIRRHDIISHFATCAFDVPALSGSYQVILSLNRDEPLNTK